MQISCFIGIIFQLFSVICDQNLIDAAKHGFMSIEIWQRDTNHRTESLVGSAKVPLHQFYIAFNNNIIRNHVSKQEVCFGSFSRMFSTYVGYC